MAYSERLANRVRALLSDRDDVDERPMFGGLTFMVGGHMCCGVHGDELIVRLHPDDEDVRGCTPPPSLPSGCGVSGLRWDALIVRKRGATSSGLVLCWDRRGRT